MTAGFQSEDGLVPGLVEAVAPTPLGLLGLDQGLGLHLEEAPDLVLEELGIGEQALVQGLGPLGEQARDQEARVALGGGLGDQALTDQPAHEVPAQCDLLLSELVLDPGFEPVGLPVQEHPVDLALVLAVVLP